MELLRKLRKERGMTQRQLADLSTVDPATISMIENGVRTPHIDTLEKLGAALNVPVAAFFDEGVQKGPPPQPRTPLTNEKAEDFDQKFAETDEKRADALRQKVEAEHTALEKYVRALEDLRLGADDLALKIAQVKYRRAEERLYALNFRANDLAFDWRTPKDTVAEYVPTNEDTEELARLILGNAAQDASEAS